MPELTAITTARTDGSNGARTGSGNGFVHRARTKPTNGHRSASGHGRTGKKPSASAARTNGNGTGVDRDTVISELAADMRRLGDAWHPDYPALEARTGYGRSWCEKAVREARDRAAAEVAEWSDAAARDVERWAQEAGEYGDGTADRTDHDTTSRTDARTDTGEDVTTPHTDTVDIARTGSHITTDAEFAEAGLAVAGKQVRP